MMFLKRVLAFSALVMIAGSTGAAFAQYTYPDVPSQPNPQYAPQPEPPMYLQLNKSEYGPNEQIVVKFKVPPNLSSGAWVGMLDAGYPHGDGEENDRHDLTYKYLNSKLQGEMTFDAPKEPGQYDLRINDGKREFYAMPFSVVSKSFFHELPGVSLNLNKTTFKPNETITVRFQGHPALSSSSWVGLLSANYPHGDGGENDKHDLSYQYLNNRLNGDLTFQAPTAPGKYDFRLNDGGREYFAIPFTVSR